MQVSNSPAPNFSGFAPETTAMRSRLQIDNLLDGKVASEADGEPGADVVCGLTQIPKTLPPKYFYDDRGSELFEQICELPEYYPTRTEAAILRRYADDIAHLTGPADLVELGSGSSTKTRRLLDAYSQLHNSSNGHLAYLPIDVSGGILEQSAYALLDDYPTLSVRGLVGTYERALDRLPPTSFPTRVILFLGSTIGNLTPNECDEFLDRVSRALNPGEYFLLGVDLRKPKSILEAAYNDSQNITAQFNLNMLSHLNSRFDGNFNLNQFQHCAFFNEKESRIEMHLCSQKAQAAVLKNLDLTVEFAAEETILTEISRKFDLDGMQADLKNKGLSPVRSWTDENHWFGVVLSQKQ
ncbi:L-histidine N(alpha)-methyltransferase [Baaleninema simplex]|uniref:L-histidine N(alpha)-methyltransferase n=1 Tax=Baaleninema simplex TaxID=2862350 RepID=UPI00034B3746|nr:L-histidine N(alpha)-methyltransferase [Baaleninema simplex]